MPRQRQPLPEWVDVSLEREMIVQIDQYATELSKDGDPVDRKTAARFLIQLGLIIAFNSVQYKIVRRAHKECAEVTPGIRRLTKRGGMKNE